jgi:anti-sigma factor RsiW
MNDNYHILEQISDYVLNLLPEAEQQRVAHHVAGCGSCHQALVRERHLVTTVRSTLDAVTRPDRARLASLRPAMPHSAVKRGPVRVWQRQLAALAAVILLLMGGVGLSAGQRAAGWFDLSPTGYPTVTDTPTMTATATAVGNLPVQVTAPPQLIKPDISPRPAVTPGPRPPSGD